MKRFLFFAIISLFTALELAAQTGTIRGKVVNDKGDPMVGAEVVIMEPEVIGSYTNDDGLFDLSKMPAGSYKVTAHFLGYDSTTQIVNVESGKTYTITLVLHETFVEGDAVEITDQKIGVITKDKVKTAITEITPEQIKIIPSVGSPDLAQYLQVLPGVVFTGDQGGQLYIRGGTPIQNQVLLDGMVIYSPFHSLGLFSVFDVDCIRTTDVYSAAFPAKYGGRVSSIMDIRTRNGNLTGFHAKFNANPFTAGVLLEGPLGRSKKEGSGVSYLLSVKNNYIDKTSPILYPYVKNNADPSTKGLPYNFVDAYGKLSFSDGANYANVFGFSHNDNVNYNFPANIHWNSYGAGANFQFLPTGASAIISGNFGYSNYKTGLNSASEKFPRSSGISGFNGGVNVSYILNKINQLDFGVNLFGFSTAYKFTNSYGLITQQNKNNTELAMYGTYKHVFLTKSSHSVRADGMFERLVIEPGVRLHYYNDQQYLSFEPRLRAKLNFDKVSFSLGSGMYAQNLMSAQSDRDVVNIFQGFLSAPETGELAGGTVNNSLQHAYHIISGAEISLMKNLSTTVEGWYKRFTQVGNINRDKIFPEDPTFIAEKGRAFGADFILKYATPTTYIYVTYGIAKVSRSYDKLKNGKPTGEIINYPTVFDRRHTINVVAAYKLGRFEAVNENGKAVKCRFSESKWEASARFTLGSGFPFTQTQGYIEKLDFFSNGTQTNYATQNGSLGLLLASNYNGGRLPYYHRLDLSLKRRWVFSNKFMLEVNSALINTYNRQNLFYFDRLRYLPVYQLPIIPSLGISLTY